MAVSVPYSCRQSALELPLENGNSPPQLSTSARQSAKEHRNLRNAARATVMSLTWPPASSSLQLWTAWLMSASMVARSSTTVSLGSHRRLDDARTMPVKMSMLSMPIPAPYNEREYARRPLSLADALTSYSPSCSVVSKRTACRAALFCNVWPRHCRADATKEAETVGGLVASIDRTMVRRLWLSNVRIVTALRQMNLLIGGRVCYQCVNHEVAVHGISWGICVEGCALTYT